SFFFIGSGTRWRWARPRSVSSSPIWRSSETLRLRRRIRRSARFSSSTKSCSIGYKVVLDRPLERVEDVLRAKKPHRLPVVFTREEVRAVLARMQGDKAVMASLLYGSGLRLMECLRLRVKDVDFGQNHIVVRDGKGQKDRVTVLPGSLVDALRKAGRAGGGAGNRDATSS